MIDSFQTYGWKEDPNLTEDVNLMDLCVLVTRSAAHLKQGSMACIIVRPPQEEVDESILSRIVSIATNSDFYEQNSSDIHAEINAIGLAAQQQVSTRNCSAYIPMKPCKRCFGALFAAGITRIIIRFEPPEELLHVALKHNMELIGLQQQDVSFGEQRKRLEAIVQNYHQHKDDIILQESQAKACPIK